MTDEKPLTPGEIAAGMTPDRKRVGLEQTGFRDTETIAANEEVRKGAAKNILDSAARLKRLPRMLGRVHSDI